MDNIYLLSDLDYTSFISDGASIGFISIFTISFLALSIHYVIKLFKV